MSDYRFVSMEETREFLTTAYYIEMQILTTFRNAASCFLSLAPCTNAETCTSCVTQLDRFQERQRISWKSVDVPLRRRSINERCFTIRQNYRSSGIVYSNFQETNSTNCRNAKRNCLFACLHFWKARVCESAIFLIYIYTATFISIFSRAARCCVAGF